MQRRGFLTTLGALAICPVCAGLARADGAHWSYEGEHGPEHWGEVSPEAKVCGIGAAQSPINIDTTIKADLPELVVQWQPGATEVVNNGHTIQVNLAQGSTMTVGDKIYDLVQFHFHHPSEHRFDGKVFAMEVHFVHKSRAGGFGVLGVMISPGAENASFAKVIAAMPQEEGKVPAPAGIDPRALLPQSLAYYRYEGSLTTPPCSETVDWHLAEAGIEVSAANIAAFAALFPMNARPIQQGNRRFVLRSS